MIDPKVIYSDLLWFTGGITICPWLIIINSKYKQDKALLAHEIMHTEQQLDKGVLPWWFKYFTSKQFRKQQEIEAYKVQIAHGAKPETLAMHLASNYYLDISYLEAYQLLTKK
jgi:hypothetical protein